VNKPIRVRLHVLSPIHIGCDDVYEPTSFVIDEQKKKLIEFDPIDFIESLSSSQKNEFSRTCEGESLLAIFKAVKRLYTSSIGGREVNLAPGILQHYKEAISNRSTYKNKDVVTQFSIEKTAYNPQNNNRYIPGSSLKGALRTGYLSMFAYAGDTVDGLKRILNGKDPARSITGRSNAKQLEEELLKGSFDKDPFRFVKVSDLLPVNNSVKTKIIYAVNRGKSSGSVARGPFQILETLQTGAVFEGNINIEEPIKEAGIAQPIYMTILLLLVHKHYARIFKKENALAQKIGFTMPKLGRFADDRYQKKTAFIVRLGRHSGAEAVTIEGNRKIKIMRRGGRKEYKNEATTVWLASEQSKPKNNEGLVPFGWAVLEIMD